MRVWRGYYESGGNKGYLQAHSDVPLHGNKQQRVNDASLAVPVKPLLLAAPSFHGGTNTVPDRHEANDVLRAPTGVSPHLQGTVAP